ncbi:MAG: hypothetical protein ACTSU8_02125 [Alphaproteobacteria bacterium]
MPKAKCTHNVVGAVGSYTGEDGNERKRWQTCGVAFTADDGRISVKFECFPVAAKWDNYLNLFPHDNTPAPKPTGEQATVCTHNLEATIGEYREKGTNTLKKRRITIGAAFTRPDGSMCLAIDAIPLAVDWSRFVSLVPKEASEKAAPASSTPEMADDDIPF